MNAMDVVLFFGTYGLFGMSVCAKSLQSCLTLWAHWTVAC